MGGFDEATRKRMQAGRLILAGKRPTHIARQIGVARQTVYEWKARLEEGGLEALRAMPQGRPKSLSPEQMAALRFALLKSPIDHGFAELRWTNASVRALIKRICKLNLGARHVTRLMKALDLGGQTLNTE